MRVAILCPGPSLAQLPPDTWAGADVLIGVNGAARMGVHWLAAFDVPMVEACAGHASVGVFSHWIRRDQLDGLPALNGLRLVLTDVLPPEVKKAGGSLSKCGALAFAGYLRADAVDIYGDDMVGETYYDGSPCAATPWRWRKEGEYTATCLDFLRARGVRVNRRQVAA